MSRAQSLAEGEWRREAQRILPMLARSRTVLVREAEGTWGVYGPKSRFRRPAARVAGSVAERFVREELVREVGREPGLPARLASPVYGLSDVGQVFLRRGRGADPFGDQHRVFERRQIEKEAVKRTVRVNIAETPTGWLRKRKNARGEPFLGEAEYEAGERLRRDFAQAGLEPRVTGHWQLERVDVSARTDYGDLRARPGAEAARRRFWAALDAMGPELGQPVVSVVCFGQGLEEMERGAELPLRAGKTLLKFGLAALARHYGLAPRPSARVRIAAMLKGEGG